METPQHPGWYDDPDDAEQLRYFDGIVWTSHTTPRRTRRQSSVAQTPAGTDTPAGGATPGGSAWEGPGRSPAPGWPPAGRDASGPSRTGPGGPQGWHGWPTPERSQDGSSSSRTQGPTTVDGVPLAPYIRRVGAYLVDGLVKGFLAMIVGAYWTIPLLLDSMQQASTAISNGQSGVLPSLNGTLTQDVIPLTLVSIIVNLGYNAVFLSRYGATPGKMALGISVRRVQAPGPISVESALRRYALQSALDLAGLIPVLGLTSLLLTALDLLWPLRDPGRQAWHDKIADTQVVLGPQPR